VRTAFYLTACVLAVLAGYACYRKGYANATRKAAADHNAEPMYVMTAHKVVHEESTNSQLDNYVIVYGSEVLQVQYAESQLSTVRPGASELEQAAPGKNLHLHSRYGSWPQEPDVSQVPQIGVPIRACEMDTQYPDTLLDHHQFSTGYRFAPLVTGTAVSFVGSALKWREGALRW